LTETREDLSRARTINDTQGTRVIELETRIRRLSDGTDDARHMDELRQQAQNVCFNILLFSFVFPLYQVAIMSAIPLIILILAFIVAFRPFFTTFTATDEPDVN
jgi:hypothetical protein